jgi:hypothetical protein
VRLADCDTRLEPRWLTVGEDKCMTWLKSLVERIAEHEVLLWWLFALSAAMIALSPLVAGWIVIRLPKDYFQQPESGRSECWRRHPGLRMVVAVGKNLLGVVLVAAGIAMLLVPGQGLLTIVVGLVLIDIPGKHRFLRWLATRAPVWRAINWLRRRSGRQPFARPES